MSLPGVDTDDRLVSVIVPCRNEAAHITGFCRSTAAQVLPEGWRMEVLVADGLSDDGTRDVLDAFCLTDARFSRVDNPGRIVSSGLNRCIEQARGGFIVRLDVHTVYAPDYIARCVAAWQATGADNVGGPWRAQGRAGAAGRMQRAIAAAFQSTWVAGGALSRDLGHSGWVDTVYLGAWPRQTFQRFGTFDEQLVRNQDDEHNLRIHRGGGRVWQSADIHSTYVPRDSALDVFRQYRQYGYWKPFVMKKHGQVAALRHLVPGLFVGGWLGLVLLALTGALVLALWPQAPRAVAAFVAIASGLALLQALAYAAGVALLSVLVARRAGFDLVAFLPRVIAAYHLGYGLGFLQGWRDARWHGQPDPAFGRLTRGPTTP